MIVDRVETFVLSNRSVLVRIETDDGAVGWGEPVVEEWAVATAAVVDRVADGIRGRDAGAITANWHRMTRGGYYRGGPLMASAVAGLDQALWDLKGRALGVPVHELLGGACRERVRIYGHANSPGRFGDAERAAAAIAAGLTMIKIAPEHPARFLETPAFLAHARRDVLAVRDAVGDDVGIAVDLHGRVDAPVARLLLPILEEAGVAFVEEPVRPEHSGQLGDLVARTPLAIATGERLYSRTEFAPVLEAGVAIVQPDPSHAGGITEVLRIAAQAETTGARLAPHCPLGPVALAACLQLDLAVENAEVQEQGLSLHDLSDERLGILVDAEPLRARGGFVDRLTGPGLGVEVDEAEVRRRAAAPRLDVGILEWRHDDGSFAEW